MDKVEEFISRRWSHSDANWLDGNCYWFSHILCAQFPCLKQYYLPVTGHWIAGNSLVNKWYDASGAITPNEEVWLIDWIKQIDPKWFEHLMRDTKD